MEIVEIARGGAAQVLQRLVSTSGDRIVYVTGTPPSAQGKMGFSEDRWPDWSRRGTTLRAFVSDLLAEHENPSGHCLYMQSAPIRVALPELMPLTSLWIADKDNMSVESTQLWIGSGGQRLAIHQDSTHSLICMVSGFKEFVLFPPDQHCNLYTAPQPQLCEWPWRSTVDPRGFDESRHPRFRQAIAASRTIRIGPGDVLFLPAYWWHAVDSFDLNIMFNSRWLDVSPERLDDMTAAFAHVVVTARGLPEGAVQELRQEIETHLSGVRTERLSDHARASWLRKLPHAPTADPVLPRMGLLWDHPLTIPPDVSVVMGDAGIRLRNNQTGGNAVLAWEFVPILQQFTNARTPSSALAELREGFHVNVPEFVDCVRELLAGDVLVSATPRAMVRSRRSHREEIAAAVAHVVLASEGLPRHHIEALRHSLEIFAFCAYGPPYTDIASERQGMLGLPLSEAATHALREIVRRNLHVRYGMELIPEDFWTRLYQIDATRLCTLCPGGLGFEEPVSRSAHVLSWEHLEVLSYFREPSSPLAVFEAIGNQWKISPVEFRTLAGGWIASGTLVPSRRAERVMPAGDGTVTMP
jgi:hypothetical protein